MPSPSPALRFRRRAFALLLALGLALAPLSADSGAWAGESGVSAATTARTPPTIDRGMMLIGCMGGLALGAVSVVLPPASAWVAAGVIGGGLGTMIVRAGFGCVYGGLGGAVASLARALVRWFDSGWRTMKGRPDPKPLAIEGMATS